MQNNLLKGAIQTEKIEKHYSDFSIFKNISLNIEPGSIVGLAGRSGSGKSTLLRCLQGLETISEGTVRLGGTSTMMFQDFQLFPHMSVFENIVYAPLAQGIPDTKEKGLDLLNRLRLMDEKDKKPSALSGGQKQRVALARCLILSPHILFADEPTSGLDVATIQEVCSLFQHAHHQGTTLVIASHDLSFLCQLSHRVILLKKGNIVADVRVKNLEDPELYLKDFY